MRRAPRGTLRSTPRGRARRTPRRRSPRREQEARPARAGRQRSRWWYQRSSRLPLLLVAVAQQDSNGVGDEDDGQQHEDGGGRVGAEPTVGIRRPLGDDDRHGGEPLCQLSEIEETVARREATGHRTDEDQWRRLAERSGEREDGPG